MNNTTAASTLLRNTASKEPKTQLPRDDGSIYDDQCHIRGHRLKDAPESPDTTGGGIATTLSHLPILPTGSVVETQK